VGHTPGRREGEELEGAHSANGTTEEELSGDTATETDRGGHGGGGGGGPHAANGVTEEELSGGDAASVEAAVVAAYPDATIERMETDAEGSAYEAHVTLGDGSKTTIKLDASFAITGTSTTG
jgi:hypothetical protein